MRLLWGVYGWVGKWVMCYDVRVFCVCDVQHEDMTRLQEEEGEGVSRSLVENFSSMNKVCTLRMFAAVNS